MRANRLRDDRGWKSVGTGEGRRPSTLGGVLRAGVAWGLVVLSYVVIGLPLLMWRGCCMLMGRGRPGTTDGSRSADD